MYMRDTPNQYLGFCLTDNTGAPLSGATVTVKRSIDGGSQTNATGSVSDLGNGQYCLLLSQADTDGKDITFYFTATSAWPIEKTITTGSGGGAPGYLSRLEKYDNISSAVKTLVSTDMNFTRVVYGSDPKYAYYMLPCATTSLGTLNANQVGIIVDPMSVPVAISNGGIIGEDATHEGYAMPGARMTVKNWSTSASDKSGTWGFGGSSLFRRYPRPFTGTTISADPKSAQSTLDYGATTIGTNLTEHAYRFAFLTSTLLCHVFADNADDIKIAAGKLNNDGSITWSAFTTVRSHASNSYRNPLCYRIDDSHVLIYWYDNTNSYNEYVCAPITDNGNGNAPTIGSPGTVVNDNSLASKLGSNCTTAMICRSGGEASGLTNFVFSGTTGSAPMLMHTSVNVGTNAVTLDVGSTVGTNTGVHFILSSGTETYWVITADTAIVSNMSFLKKITYAVGSFTISWSTPIFTNQGTANSYLLELDTTNGIAYAFEGDLAQRIHFDPSTGAFRHLLHVDQWSLVGSTGNTVNPASLTSANGMRIVGNRDYMVWATRYAFFRNIGAYFPASPSGVSSTDSGSRGEWFWHARNNIGGGGSGSGFHHSTRRLVSGYYSTLTTGGNYLMHPFVWELPKSFSTGAEGFQYAG